ncbi:hypothetical protein M422DRAFT_41975 [Sphaerobolus stellatus SS14]|nr:hypothetical protein M422DRAFT_41975 [Sphaerobolus stellatus SS14]
MYCLQHLRRGTFRVDSTISYPFVYCLRSSPSVPSELQQLAYRQEREASGPKRDPEGRESVDDMTVEGILFDKCIAEVTCVERVYAWNLSFHLQFYLSNPLSYAGGGSIPFYIYWVLSVDAQALDLFAARGSLSIVLMRTLTEQIDAKTTEINTLLVGRGAYWPSGENLPQTEMRRLTGEIPLKEDLQPTFKIENVSITVRVI